MIKSSNKIQIALDNNNNVVYNTSMTNNNKGNDMINKAHDVQVIKHIGTSYDVYANFPTVQEALDYMRRMAFANHCWYIVNADGVRLRLNDQNKLEVFHSLVG
jgi:uncharacterized tellurite resistance protein B-like protein